MADRKEHHFCFAYKGERLRITPFEKLHFASVQGTSTLDGAQLVRVSLQRRNGRRSSTIPRIIQEYNALSGTDHIVPCRFVASQPMPIQCFKMNQLDNPIVLRIESDRTSGSSRFWSWEAAEGHASSKKKKNGFSGLEGLVRNELNLDPSVVCMQSAYDQIARAYFQVYGTELKNSGTFPAEDKEFILSELRLHFDRERMYRVAPNTLRELTPAAKAIAEADECMMGDLCFTCADGGATASSSGAPNATVLKYLRTVLEAERGRDTVVTVSLKTVLDEFNSDSAGFYKRTCIVPFMTPFVATRAVEMEGETLRIHTRLVAEQIAKFE